MNILDQIISDKKREIELKKKVISKNDLEKFSLFKGETISLKKNLANSSSGIIAEHKRKSPSKDVINNAHKVENVVKDYTNSGVCGISVLTDIKYFGGSVEDLVITRSCTNLPLLRKDFIVDIYQIVEAKAYGVDVILLIASVLNSNEISALSSFAKSIGLEVLLEIHNLEELNKSMFSTIDMIGVNNRNLKNFEISIENSLMLVDQIPNDFLKISESGLNDVDSIKSLRKKGFQGFLIGEYFMKSDDIYKVTNEFISQI